jgi:acylphosphatase
MTERRRIHVTGHVQGVFFRNSAKEQAESLGLAGFVRNEPDGSVLVMIEGGPDKLDQFIAWCGEGPPDAAVVQVAVTEQAAEGLQGFEVRR